MLVSFECSRCKNTTYLTRKVNNATGIYCAKCGKWHKWLNAHEKKIVLLDTEMHIKVVPLKYPSWLRFEEVPYVCRTLNIYNFELQKLSDKILARVFVDNTIYEEEKFEYNAEGYINSFVWLEQHRVRIIKELASMLQNNLSKIKKS